MGYGTDNGTDFCRAASKAVGGVSASYMVYGADKDNGSNYKRESDMDTNTNNANNTNYASGNCRVCGAYQAVRLLDGTWTCDACAEERGHDRVVKCCPDCGALAVVQVPAQHTPGLFRWMCEACEAYHGTNRSGPFAHSQRVSADDRDGWTYDYAAIAEATGYSLDQVKMYGVAYCENNSRRLEEQQAPTVDTSTNTNEENGMDTNSNSNMDTEHRARVEHSIREATGMLFDYTPEHFTLRGYPTAICRVSWHQCYEDSRGNYQVVLDVWSCVTGWCNLVRVSEREFVARIGDRVPAPTRYADWVPYHTELDRETALCIAKALRTWGFDNHAEQLTNAGGDKGRAAVLNMVVENTEWAFGRCVEVL